MNKVVALPTQKPDEVLIPVYTAEELAKDIRSGRGIRASIPVVREKKKVR